MHKRSRNVFSATNEQKLELVFKRHNGNWSKIVADETFKEIGCFKKEAKESIDQRIRTFNLEFINTCKDNSLEEIIQSVTDWRYDINFIKKRPVIRSMNNVAFGKSNVLRTLCEENLDEKFFAILSHCEQVISNDLLSKLFFILVERGKDKLLHKLRECNPHYRNWNSGYCIMALFENYNQKIYNILVDKSYYSSAQVFYGKFYIIFLDTNVEIKKKDTKLLKKLKEKCLSKATLKGNISFIQSNEEIAKKMDQVKLPNFSIIN